jgi:hypothetical protein
MALPACPHKDSIKMNARMEDWQNDTEWGKLKQWEKNHPSATVSSTNLTQTNPHLNQIIDGQRLVTTT